MLRRCYKETAPVEFKLYQAKAVCTLELVNYCDLHFHYPYKMSLRKLRTKSVILNSK